MLVQVVQARRPHPFDDCGTECSSLALERNLASYMTIVLRQASKQPEGDGDLVCPIQHGKVAAVVECSKCDLSPCQVLGMRDVRLGPRLTAKARPKFAEVGRGRCRLS